MANKNNDYYATDDSPIEDDNEISQAIAEGTVDAKSQKLANWLMTKMFGEAVRKSLSLFVEWTSVMFNDIKDSWSSFKDSISNRQDNIEKRQNDVESQFKDVIANATTDSEVINARDSSKFGKFTTLDNRLESDEDLLASTVPTEGIFNNAVYKSELGYHPTVSVLYYENAIGTSGFLQNDLVFGDSIVVPVGITYSPDSHWTVKVPKKYYIKASSVASTTEKNVWYKTIEVGTTSKTLRIEFKKEV